MNVLSRLPFRQNSVLSIDPCSKNTGIYGLSTSNVLSNLFGFILLQETGVTPVWAILYSRTYFRKVEATFPKYFAVQTCTNDLPILSSPGLYLTRLVLADNLAQYTLEKNWCAYAVELPKRNIFVFGSMRFFVSIIFCLSKDLSLSFCLRYLFLKLSFWDAGVDCVLVRTQRMNWLSSMYDSLSNFISATNICWFSLTWVARKIEKEFYCLCAALLQFKIAALTYADGYSSRLLIYLQHGPLLAV